MSHSGTLAGKRRTSEDADPLDVAVGLLLTHRFLSTVVVFEV